MEMKTYYTRGTKVLGTSLYCFFSDSLSIRKQGQSDYAAGAAAKSLQSCPTV